MTGSVLGLICAGLILLTHSPEQAGAWPASSAERLGFLLVFAISFGAGATLTGTVFSMFERF